MNVEDLIRIFSLAASFYTWFLGAYVICKGLRKELNILFGLFCMTIGILTFSDFARKMMVDLALALTWTKLTLMGAILLMGALLHFSLAFPPRSGKLKRKTVPIALYIPSAVFTSLIPSNLIVSGVRWEEWRYSAEWGGATIAFGIVFSIYTLTSVIILVKKVWALQIYRHALATILGIVVIGIMSNFVPTPSFEFPTILLLALSTSIVFGSLILRFGFIVEPKSMPAMKGAPSRYNLPPTVCYIVEEDRPEDSLKLFQELVGDGRPGLLISRIQPNIDIPSHVLWYRLSGLDEENTINPSDMLSLQQAVRIFVSKKSRAIVFVQGLEYLKTYLDLPTILKIQQFWSDQVFKNSANLIISVNPNAWDPIELALLKSELKPFKAERRTETI